MIALYGSKMYMCRPTKESTWGKIKWGLEMLGSKLLKGIKGFTAISKILLILNKWLNYFFSKPF